MQWAWQTVLDPNNIMKDRLPAYYEDHLKTTVYKPHFSSVLSPTDLSIRPLSYKRPVLYSFSTKKPENISI